MNRRAAIKSVFAYGLLIVGAASSYELIRLNRKPDFKYLASKKTLIAELAEIIIPKTDTPGAKDAAVEDYILYAAANVIPAKEANTFIDGLQALEQTSKVKYNCSFENCNNEQRRQILIKLRGERLYPDKKLFRKIDKKLRGNTFFETLKELTVIGYCTSEIGATQGMAYDYIPKDYISCDPLQKNQKCWATK